ncbi:MAG: DEAD/DEAH box helicase family protein [Rhodobacteraceae bacterium]|nr:DEAD/DEAH box helicase family protein [Paracoccaceae bacterium]
MTVPDLPDFRTLFCSLTGYDPYPWQARLYERMCSGHLPGALDIPTGLGKTSVIAIWLLARASGAAVPRRLVYVVDRRTVVDQTTKEAHVLRAALEREGCRHIRDRLGLKEPLPISTLRGQFADNR